MKLRQFPSTRLQIPNSNSNQPQIYNSKHVETITIQKLEKHTISVQTSQLKKQNELYEWRQRTDFPIVKIQSFKIVESRFDKTYVEVILNSCWKRIDNCSAVELDVAILWIKEVFVALERLVNKFGMFQIGQRMVVVDQKGKAKVWVNENFSLNIVQYPGKEFDACFGQAVNVFEQATVSNPTSMSFYLQLKKTNCFIKGLKFIEEFIKSRKLKPAMRQQQQNQQQQIKKINSTPNLYLTAKYPANSLQTSPHLRETISHTTRNRLQQSSYQAQQVLTFSSKSSKPLQNKIQQMIRELPKSQISQKNSLLLFGKGKGKEKEKEKEKGKDSQGQLKKVFKSVKQFKFRKVGKDGESSRKIEETYEDDATEGELVKCPSIDNLRADSTRREHTPKKPTAYFSQPIQHQQQRSNNTLDKSRPSITETRSTSFFASSCEQFSKFHTNHPQHESEQRRFGSNIKFSEISYKKNSETSESSKDIQNILMGMDGGDVVKEFGQQHQPHQQHQQRNIIRSQQTIHSPFAKSNTKYGDVTDQIEEPTAEELNKKYNQLGWKTVDFLTSQESQLSDMKMSIHANDEGHAKGSEKVPLKLGKLDKIKSAKQMVQSMMDEEFWA